MKTKATLKILAAFNVGIRLVRNAEESEGMAVAQSGSDTTPASQNNGGGRFDCRFWV